MFYLSCKDFRYKREESILICWCGTGRIILMVRRSSPTSLTCMLGPWIHFVAIFKMCLLVSFIWNMKTISWFWCPSMVWMSGGLWKIQDNWWGDNNLQVPWYCAKPLTEKSHCGITQHNATSIYCIRGDMVHKALDKLCFAFFLALSEVNATLVEHQFGGVEDVRSMLDFSILTYRNLIDNPYLRQDYLKSCVFNTI